MALTIAHLIMHVIQRPNVIDVSRLVSIHPVQAAWCGIWAWFSGLKPIHSKSDTPVCDWSANLERYGCRQSTNRIPNRGAPALAPITNEWLRHYHPTIGVGNGSKFRWFGMRHRQNVCWQPYVGPPHTPSSCAKMASPLFCHGLLNDFRFEPLFSIHLLQTGILGFQLTHSAKVAWLKTNCLRNTRGGSNSTFLYLSMKTTAIKTTNKLLFFIITIYWLFGRCWESHFCQSNALFSLIWDYIVN